jgi:hypothetical protein
MPAALPVAALSDFHANVPALEAVLAEVERVSVDRIVIGGDVVPGPLPVETIERKRALGDRAVFGARQRRSLGSRHVRPMALNERGRRAPGAAVGGGTADAIDRRDRDPLASLAGRDAAAWPLCVEAPVRLERPRSRYSDHRTPSSGTDL